MTAPTEQWEDVRRRFVYREPQSDAVLALHQGARQVLQVSAMFIIHNTHPSCEQSLALTALEERCSG